MLKQTSVGVSRPLAILGIGKAEELIYDWLLAHPSATVSEIGHESSFPLGEIRRVLIVLESKGLVTHVPQRPRRYVASAPDIALKALALHHHESLTSRGKDL